MEHNDSDILKQVQELIEKSKSTPADIMAKSILVLDEDRRRIEKAIGHNVSTSKELADRIERALSVSVDGMMIPLSPYLLDRLKSRAIRVDWDKFVPMTIKRLLEEFCGLR